MYLAGEGWRFRASGLSDTGASFMHGYGNGSPRLSQHLPLQNSKQQDMRGQTKGKQNPGSKS